MALGSGHTNHTLHVLLPSSLPLPSPLPPLPSPYMVRYVFQVDSGVMSLDIHPEHPYLIAVGLYDGTVAVYTLKDKGSNPLYRSTTKTGKHVWQLTHLGGVWVECVGGVCGWSVLVECVGGVCRWSVWVV